MYTSTTSHLSTKRRSMANETKAETPEPMIEISPQVLSNDKNYFRSPANDDNAASTDDQPIDPKDQNQDTNHGGPNRAFSFDFNDNAQNRSMDTTRSRDEYQSEVNIMISVFHHFVSHSIMFRIIGMLKVKVRIIPTRFYVVWAASSSY